jgi:hypothetical protein
VTTPQTPPYWNEIVGHFLDAVPMSEAARAHYLSDPTCIAAVTELLSRSVPTDSSPSGATRGGNLPEAARLALEQARGVLKREFGIERGQGE